MTIDAELDMPPKQTAVPPADVAAPEAAAPQGDWVRLEIFGHRCHYGLLTEVERFGTKMARIDVYHPGEDTPCASVYYPGSAIFSITPTDEKTAREQAGLDYAAFRGQLARLTYSEAADDDERPF